tara:strand:+ start:1848 stop:2567 length:720 start_codon:yes stop_codon:yes gene_type:complete
MDLTILIPVKNEENNIDSIVGEIKSNILINHEIVFINDFCTDNTCLKIKSLQKLHSNILLINNKKRGLGESVRNGINNSNGKYISILMCDNSDDLKDLNLYFKEIHGNNLDAVFGSRFLKNSIVTDYPKMKYILNRIFNLFVGLIYLNSYNDYTNAFKIYKKSVLIELEPIVSESFNVFLELPLKIINRKLKYKIIPINWYGRIHGITKFKLNELKSKYIFTLIYCFAEKILLLNKENK